MAPKQKKNVCHGVGTLYYCAITFYMALNVVKVHPMDLIEGTLPKIGTIARFAFLYVTQQLGGVDYVRDIEGTADLHRQRYVINYRNRRPSFNYNI